MTLRRVVTVTRQPDIQQSARQISREVFVADDLTDALDISKTINPDLILFDHRFSPAHINEFINKTDKNSKNVPIIVVGNGQNQPELAARFKQIGAYDYLQGTQDYKRLPQILRKMENEQNPNAHKTNFFAEEYAASVNIVGRSEAILKKLKMIKIVAKSNCNPILIVGETGTGKELAAKAIHLIRHPNEQFVAVNCAALTANLLESELFGHVKGAFTGADREKTGLLELAGSGSLFLDEISEMPMELQAKLLRVIQEKKFRKVGGIKNITTNATIIASSNQNLKTQVQERKFRQDLYYRLNICPVTIPPLRSPDRKDDIPLLAEYFLKNSNICPDKSGKITSLTKLAVETLQKHDWPGNVRELANVIDRAILLETTDKIGLSSIIFDVPEYPQTPAAQKTNQIKDFSLEKAERELITRALQQTGWQKTKAAVLLGITRATLYAKVKQYNIEKNFFTPEKAQNDIPTPISTPYSTQPITVA